MSLSACSNGEYQSSFDRVVSDSQNNDPLAEVDSNEEGSQSSEEETVSETPGPILLFDKVLQNSDIPEEALYNAFAYYDEHHDDIPNQKWITIFDIKQHSGNRRFYMINMETGDVTAIHTSHGKNSDTDHNGYAESFSNVNGSNKSSLGFMLTAETYFGSNGYSLRMDGLEARNSNVRARAIVIHGASYVSPTLTKMGRSLGCPAVSNPNHEWVIDRLKGGSLFYIYNEDYE